LFYRLWRKIFRKIYIIEPASRLIEYRYDVVLEVNYKGVVYGPYKMKMYDKLYVPMEAEVFEELRRER